MPATGKYQLHWESRRKAENPENTGTPVNSWIQADPATPGTPGIPEIPEARETPAIPKIPETAITTGEPGIFLYPVLRGKAASWEDPGVVELDARHGRSSSCL